MDEIPHSDDIDNLEDLEEHEEDDHQTKVKGKRPISDSNNHPTVQARASGIGESAYDFRSRNVSSSKEASSSALAKRKQFSAQTSLVNEEEINLDDETEEQDTDGYKSSDGADDINLDNEDEEDDYFDISFLSLILGDVDSGSSFSFSDKLQDEVIISDAERLKMTQANVKLLQRHFQADSFQWIQRLKQKEQTLLRRLLRYVGKVMRIVEALESKGYRIPLMKGEAELSEKLAAIARRLKGPGTELSSRVHNLLSITRMRANSGDFRDSIHILGSAKLQEQSLCDLQEALQQENEAIARLGNVLKRDVRDLEIIMSEGTDMLEDGRHIWKIQ
ncbi:hypothetical protein ZIOFF_013713 [Zingiber officinale]|uniref:Nucleoporin Nup54 alpha-helical domain-containing protein n=1 Tax=Zingiber officinale TaxID=94328 RepID=A0A8J5HG64_ZINOF|nr:hypothetical protein ZIOFF_013713 [Zingiber officinale]